MDSLNLPTSAANFESELKLLVLVLKWSRMLGTIAGCFQAKKVSSCLPYPPTFDRAFPEFVNYG